jgi:hypothetical protein
MEALGLKSQNYGHPPIFIREMKYYASILPGAVVICLILGVPLVHVDGMNAASRHKGLQQTKTF